MQLSVLKSRGLLYQTFAVKWGEYAKLFEERNPFVSVGEQFIFERYTIWFETHFSRNPTMVSMSVKRLCWCMGQYGREPHSGVLLALLPLMGGGNISGPTIFVAVLLFAKMMPYCYFAVPTLWLLLLVLITCINLEKCDISLAVFAHMLPKC